MRSMRLYTFSISHFSEKARWALDLNRIAYEERRLVPGPHVATIRRRAKRTTVPVLVHDGVAVQESSAILDYLEQKLGARRLAPRTENAARSAELEALADRAYGLGTQRIFYDVLLERPEVAIDLWSQAGPIWARAFFAVGFGFVARGVRRMYKIRPDKVAESKELFRRTFDETDRILEKSAYLLGDELTRVDITVASLLAPLCTPPEHLLRWPTDPPPVLAAFIAEFEGRPTWNFVRRMYKDHRKESDDG